VISSVTEYWDGQCAALERVSVEVESHADRADMVIYQDPRRPERGIIDARIWFDEEAFLDVYERVEIDSKGTPHRRQYSYHLSVEGHEVERYDLDPDIEDESLRYHVNRPGPGGGFRPK